MAECPYCNKIFSSDGSYRVHKHRFHRGQGLTPVVAVEVPTVEPEPPIEPTTVMPEFMPVSNELKESTQSEHRGGGSGGAIVIGGALLLLGLIAAKSIYDRKRRGGSYE